MNRTPKQIVDGVEASTSAAAVYTAPTGAKAIIRKVTLHNTGAGNNWVNAWLVESGGAADDSNKVLHELTLSTGQTVSPADLVGHVIEAGGALYLQAQTANEITVHASAVEVV